MALSIFLCMLLIGMCAFDVTIGIKCFHHNNPKGQYLGWACLSAFGVTFSYLISILLKGYVLHSLWSSLYFVFIDILLLLLLKFFLLFTAEDGVEVRSGPVWYLLVLLCVVDSVLMLVNVRSEIVITYSYIAKSGVNRYTFELLPLFNLHFLYVYLLIGMMLVCLITKMLTVPSVFHERYLRIILSVLAIVAVNAMYLYLPEYNLDYSVVGYGIGALMLYSLTFGVNSSGMTRALQNWIFSNIDQGIVLFDYNNELAFHNSTAERFLPLPEWRNHLRIEEFVRAISLDADLSGTAERQVGLCYVKDAGGVSHPLHYEYSSLLSDRRALMGRLFVFTEMTNEADPITGFHARRYFANNVDKIAVSMTGEIDVVVFDINRLKDVNSTKGRDAGDRMIRQLSVAIKNCFPAARCLFVRGREASLAVVCVAMEKDEINTCAEQVAQQMSDEDIDIQYAQSHGGSVYDAPSTIETATRVLIYKKLLDASSAHSNILGILVQSLKVCDKDTEAHVKRTQYMGEELGRRIGLTEDQQSKLALLAILHDIGKIGIPLDILNKPGRLTDSEWSMLKTHSEKGSQIASRSTELAEIADMILHHHEHWDGTGYPDGLRKETIPLLSRVIAVVDAYDAMTNDRAYRKALSQEQAFDELKRCAGTQFDPYIVSAFLQMVREMPPQEQETVPEDPGASTVPELTVPESVHQHELLRVHRMNYTRYVLDKDMRILSVDDRFEKLTGYTKEEALAGMTQADLIFEEDLIGYFKIVNAVVPRDGMGYLEHRLRRKDGQMRFVFCMGRMFYDSSVKETRYELVVTDSTESYAVKSLVSTESGKAQRRLEQWESKYRSDSLTGLLNHEAFKNDVEQYLLGDGVGAMMLMIDIDYFKEYNDNNGHRAGDECLVLVAQTLSGALRSNDFSCRMGGDEFAAVLTFDASVPKETMIRRANQICDKINMTMSTIGVKRVSTISMGGAFMDEEHGNFDKLYEAADQALYRAKNAGRARFSL